MAGMDYTKLSVDQLINEYEAGLATLLNVTAGVTRKNIRQRITPGKWSILEVVCHITDFEVIYAERLRRILAEVEPTLFNGEPDDFERTLSYDSRDIEEELSLITSVRRQTSRILRSLPEVVWQRKGIHNIAGPLTFRQIVQSSTNHIPHHVDFITGKLESLRAKK